MRQLILIVLAVICGSWIAPGCKKQKEQEPIIRGEIPTHALKNEKDLDSLLAHIGDARIVLLGEASHGTAEYYNWRAAITKRLMQEKGFNCMAVEGEWADSYRVNNFVKGGLQDSTAAINVLKNYERWPTWMWGNYEIASLISWMNHFNQGRPATQKVGFYGLDVYCLWESTLELMPYLQGADPSVISAANQVQQCFQPFSADAQQYGYAVANAGATCRAQTTGLWNSLASITGASTARDERGFVMQQNGLVALNGERYYRTSVTSYEESWNIRDRHMSTTLERLADFLGTNSKIVVWEHNTHVGDARYTDMADQGMVNVGQLAREKFGAGQVFSVGFGSYSGSVIAASEWGGAIETMRVPEAPANTWEGYLHTIGSPDKIVYSSEIKDQPQLKDYIGHRAIGVVYNPAREQGNYVPSIIPQRYDAFVFIDKTSALHPIDIKTRNEPPDTYPSGY